MKEPNNDTGKRKRIPIAVLCSDLHLSLRQPACRADKDWLGVQAHYLEQLKRLTVWAVGDGRKQTSVMNLPIICAGDIFDRWNASPEIINFALEHLPDGMICIPGQHDLPNHRTEEMHRCGYGVLVKAEKIKNIYSRPGWNFNSGIAFGFPWGDELLPCPVPRKQGIVHLAVIHDYCWTIPTGYPGAPEENHLASFKKVLKGYDAAVFGDNHKGFLKHLNTGTWVMNCGTFIRRKADEIDYRPSVGLLMGDGSIERHYLDTSIDKFHEHPGDREEVAVNMKEFIDGLEKLGEHGLDFREAVENLLRTGEYDTQTKELVLKSLEDNKT